jgi:hypothetical protein
LLIAAHHLDCPWRPSDLTQRDGRILHQGNKNSIVKIFRYVTKGTFDSYLYQIQEQKLRYISQIMTGKSISRSCEDVDATVLNAAEIKAIATSNPLLAEKMQVDNEVIRLKLLKSNWNNEKLILKRNITENYPKTISYCEQKIIALKKDIEISSQTTNVDFRIIIDGRTYDERAKAGEVLMALLKINEVSKNQPLKIGIYKGFDFLFQRTAFDQIELCLKGQSSYSVPVSDSGTGNIIKLENLFERIPHVLKNTEQKLSDTLIQLEESRKEVDKPFEFEEKLKSYLARHTEINTKLEFNELKNQEVIIDDIKEDEEVPENDCYEVAEEEYAYSEI